MQDLYRGLRREKTKATRRCGRGDIPFISGGPSFLRLLFFRARSEKKKKSPSLHVRMGTRLGVVHLFMLLRLLTF